LDYVLNMRGRIADRALSNLPGFGGISDGRRRADGHDAASSGDHRRRRRLAVGPVRGRSAAIAADGPAGLVDTGNLEDRSSGRRSRDSTREHTTGSRCG
jgi:hypothetical protein